MTTYRVHAAVAVVLELALAVCAGLCCEGTGDKDEAETDYGDHVGCRYEVGMRGVGLASGLDRAWLGMF